MTIVFCASLVLFAATLISWKIFGSRPADPDKLLAEAALNGWRLGRSTPRWIRASALVSGVMSLVSMVWIAAADEPLPRGEALPRVAAARVIHPHVKSAWNQRSSLDIGQLRRVMERIQPLHRRPGKIRPGNWLAVHREPGQLFGQYLKARPSTPTARRSVIYIQPVGLFSTSERRTLNLTAEFMSIYFCLPVKIVRDLPIAVIPAAARRRHHGRDQILSTHVLYNVLRPRLPRDAHSFLALTTMDLWPGRGWNFVFGQASLRERVGVWSIQRNGDPDRGPASFRRFLLRTIKTATHETGHMLSILHCTRYSCNMAGSNSRAESDRHPLALCPECLAKVAWASRCDPVGRARRLIGFCDANGLAVEASFYRKQLEAMSAGDGL